MGVVAGRQLLDEFCRLMFVNSDDISSWKVRSHNEILVRLKNRNEYIFRFDSAEIWRIETVKMYEKKVQN